MIEKARPTAAMRIRENFDADDLTPEELNYLIREFNVIGVKLCVGMKLSGLAYQCTMPDEGVGGAPALNMALVQSEASGPIIDAMNEVGEWQIVPAPNDEALH